MKSDKKKGTAIGIIAIVLWGALALLSDVSSQIPAFQLMAMSFAIGFLTIACKWKLSKLPILSLVKQPLPVWLLTVFGLFGYHFCYFLALRYAPVLQAGLIAYLWPLLIVIFSVWLLNRPVGRFLWLGVILSLIGCILLIWTPEARFESSYLVGYGLALACALVWSLYSVLSARFTQVSSDFIGWGCFATALLALVCHLALENTLWPLSFDLWLGVSLLGIGPVGFAFVAWDYGMKNGDVALLGSLSYLAPLLSTALLILWGNGVLTIGLAVGGGCVILGAVFASLNK